MGVCSEYLILKELWKLACFVEQSNRNSEFYELFPKPTLRDRSAAKQLLSDDSNRMEDL